MSDEADGFSVAATRQNAGSALKGGTPRPPLYPRPSPAVLPVTLPGTSGTAPIVPASADDPPPPRAAGFTGGVNAPALTTAVSVIVVFGNDSDASFAHASGACAACMHIDPPASTTIDKRNV